jgi:hypothetical protein
LVASTQRSASLGSPRARPRTAADLAEDALSVDFDAGDMDVAVPDETLIGIRADEILRGVWAELNGRMMTRSTSKGEFFETNMHLALDLATKELNAQRDQFQRTEVRHGYTDVCTSY